jgi:hypothetical protein
MLWLILFIVALCTGHLVWAFVFACLWAFVEGL